jgi:O-antigen/teichoic acid export membrane protein
MSIEEGSEGPLAATDAAVVTAPPPHTGGRSLKSLAIHGTAWTLVAYGSAQVLRLASSIVLTRLLLPQYFGLMTLLNTLLTGLNLFSDVGLNANVTQNPRGDDPSFLNTVWTIQVLRGLTLWGACVVLGWPAAVFYREPALRFLLPALGLGTLISGFDSTALLTLSRHLGVRKLSLLELGTHAFQVTVTIVWALVHPSVWALVGGRLCAETMKMIVSHRMGGGWQNHFHWERAALKSVFEFGRWVFVATALCFLALQSDRLILGRLVSFRTLGLYGIAYSLADIPRQVILAFCGKVAFPYMAKLAHLPRDRYRAAVLRYRWMVLLATALILTIVLNTADLALVHIYDKRYHAAAWMIPIFALGLWHTVLYSTTTPCLLALGKSSYNAAGFFLAVLVLFIGLPLSYYAFGMIGAVVIVAFSDFPMYVVNLRGLWKHNLLTLGQDAKATALFILICSLGVAIRFAVVGGFPPYVPLH